MSTPFAEPAPEEDGGVRQHQFFAPPGACVITLVRHGESQAFRPETPFPVCDGHSDPPLHRVGVAQADRLGERLAADQDPGREISAVYVTSLQRTHQTAAPLCARLGVAPRPIPDLAEVHLGEWEGSFRTRIGEPEFLKVLEEERWDLIPGAESHDGFTERVRRGITTIAGAHPDQRVVSVSHGGVIGHILSLATGARGFSFVGADNASISEIVVHGDRWHVRRFNDTEHLRGLG
jgi:probable phosphoglycerate mutase